MNTAMQHLGLRACALVIALTAPFVLAQESDAYLDRYELAFDSLRSAVAALPDDPVLAREQIDQAFNALRTLSRDVASGPLALSLERVFERARTAITNGSQDDLAVQSAVLVGGFQRLVLDASLRAAGDGNLPLARARLDRLAHHLGMDPSDRARLVDPEAPPTRLRLDVESSVAAVIAARLAEAREALAEGSAYRSLASAYGAFLLVQDSPRAASTLNGGFVAAAAALVAGDGDAFAASLAAVETDVAALEAAAREGAAAPPTLAEPAPVSAAAESAELPALITPEAEPAAAAGEPTTSSEDAAPVLASEALADLVDAEGVLDLAALRPIIEAEQRRERLEVLEGDLAAAGVPAALRTARAEALLAAGFDRLDRVVDRFSARAADVVAAAHRGDAAASTTAVTAAQRHYEVHLSPVVRSISATADGETLDLLARLTAGDVRVQDAAVLAGQAEAVRSVLRGGTGAWFQDAARGTTAIWSGLVRAIALLVVALLALAPLVLLNLAFGGGNRTWQLVGVALFLLLLPLLYEGVVALASLLALVVDAPFLTALAAYSVFSSTMGQVAWAALTLVAILFATAGLYGICVQFGLIGRRPVPATSRATKTTRATRSTNETIDWDDDT
jgi:hypothetical protein